MRDYFERYPLFSHLPYEAYDVEHQLFINKKKHRLYFRIVSFNRCYRRNRNLIDKPNNGCRSIEADVQFLLWASPKIAPMLKAFEAQRSGIGEPFEWLAKQRTDFLSQGTLNTLSKQGSFILRDFRLYLVLSMPKKEVEQQLQELSELREDLQSSLKSIHCQSRNLPVESFMSVMWDLLNPSSGSESTSIQWNGLDPLNIQLTDPEYHVKVSRHKLCLANETEDWDIRSFTIRDFPKGRWTQWKMTDCIGQLFNTALQIPCPFVISLSIKPLESEKSSATAQMKAMNRESTAKSPLAKFKPGVTQEYRDWELVRTQLANGDRLVRIFYQVVTYAPQEEGNRAERKVRDLYHANGWKLRKENFMQFQSWLAMFPMMMTEGFYQDLKLFGRLRTILASNAVTLAPLQGNGKD